MNAERIPAYEGKEPYLFISYAHKNTAQVMPILEALFAQKIRFWYDEGIAPGSEWPKNIEDHLRDAAGVVVFVSKESLESPNCENEVVNSTPESRKGIAYSLDGSTHAKLEKAQKVSSPASLLEQIGTEYVGDGVKGYARGIGMTGRKNLWTSLIVVAAGLILALGVGVYGLNDGWFDSVLPGLAEVNTEDVTEKPQEAVITGNNVLIDAITKMTKAELASEIAFRSEETRALLYRAIDFESWGQETPLTYQNLATLENDFLYLEEVNDELLQYLKYFPKLNTVQIRKGTVTTLEPLLECAHLARVEVAYDVFPFEIPENAPFTVYFWN